MTSLVPASEGGHLKVDADVLEVVFGEPPLFRTSIPRKHIRSVTRVADRTNQTRGVHGGRGKWLVNRTTGDLVRIDVDPPAAAALTPSQVRLPSEPRGVLARLVLRFALRDRSSKVRQLTVSVEDPDAFVEALS